LLSSSSRISLENAFGLALMQFCSATNGFTQSEPYKIGAIAYSTLDENIKIQYLKIKYLNFAYINEY
jgi:hypothetical protein